MRTCLAGLIVLVVAGFAACNRCDGDTITGTFSDRFKGNYLFKRSGSDLEVHIKINKASIREEDRPFVQGFELAEQWKLRIDSAHFTPVFSFIEASNTMNPDLYLLLKFKYPEVVKPGAVALEFENMNNNLKISLTEDEKVCFAQIME